ncbi:MAG: signal recognition particle protein [Planctomycetota bacterium]
MFAGAEAELRSATPLASSWGAPGATHPRPPSSIDRLTESLQRALGRFAPARELTDAHLDEGLREVRRALLEADVPLEVLRPFLERVRAKARGARTIPGVQPAQQVVAAVHEELVALLGPVDTRLPQGTPARPGVLLVLGLQGTGKTTSCAKLAAWLAARGRRPLLVAADLQRPAAALQLAVLAEQAGVPVFRAEDVERRGLRRLLGGELHPAAVCEQGIARAQATGRDLVILDTAGRLHVDDALLAELREVARVARPDRRLLVVDAMSGQDALRSAAAFRAAVDFDGVLLSKADGDARGGAALAVKALTGRPIQFLGVGERLADLEELRPEGLASRILGMGDVVRLVELAREQVDPRQAEDAAERLRRGQLDFEDFLAQLRAVQRIGLRRVLGLLPGMGALGQQLDGSELARVEAIICSMTREERRAPQLLSGPRAGKRRRRIAHGSGRRVQEVNRLLKDWKQMQRALRGLRRAGRLRDRPHGPYTTGSFLRPSRICTGEAGSRSVPST